MPRGHFAFGHNFRMNELQAAVSLAQLGKLPTFSARRKELTAVLEEALAGVDGIELPHVYPHTEPNYWVYPVRGPARPMAQVEINYLETAYQAMQRERQTPLGIALPDHVQYVPGLCPRAEEAAPRFRAIPIHHGSELEEVREAARAVRKDVESLLHGRTETA
jgi:dTDP-4-amino-4,6-dideoxygalactose transaminase